VQSCEHRPHPRVADRGEDAFVSSHAVLPVAAGRLGEKWPDDECDLEKESLSKVSREDFEK
jgi:hypothetical protein